ncbi:helix-turn-helix domain-containing protein [Effusibacillus pohliae]|uniref:helix-turn-helix domain-containing protein n=1 Tax=Effusibacillus pohliae TaxID=232270 RepID=UPI0012EADA36
MVVRAKNGDKDALAAIIQRFMPAIRKYSRRLGYEEAYSDLVEWMIKTVNRFPLHILEKENKTKN